MKIKYQDINFQKKTALTIANANAIIAEYQSQGFTLTLRQLYYQFVARGFVKNNLQEYKKLSKTLKDARLAGLVSWHAITDTTRSLKHLPHWEHPEDVLYSAEMSFRLDHWQGQEYRPEVWIEKDALVGVISDICRELDIPYFSCRGYVSISEVWEAGERLKNHIYNKQIPYILYFGDHDPSGLDMTRDITDRLEMFGVGSAGRDFHINRMALNPGQIADLSLPPNFAKTTDSRSQAYIDQHGFDSWELDALEPSVMIGLITDAIDLIKDQDKWDKVIKAEKSHKRNLRKIRENYETIIKEF